MDLPEVMKQENELQELYPEKYRELRTQRGQIDFRQDQVEYMKAAGKSFT